MPLDPFGSYDDYDNPWIDLINRGIDRAEQAYIYGELGYPPQPVYAPVYAPNYPAPSPQPIPMPAPGATPQPQGGSLQLSNTTLMLIVGGVLLFMLGKRGR